MFWYFNGEIKKNANGFYIVFKGIETIYSCHGDKKTIVDGEESIK